MENKAHALAAGIFVAGVAALLLALAAWLTRDAGQTDVYEIATRESLTGLQEQAPVRLRGVEVGKVTRIGFDPREQGQVLVRLAIDRQAPVTRETFATLGFQGVTGLSFVQLDDNGQPAPRLEPQDGQPPRIPLRPGLVSRLTDRGEMVLGQVEQAVARMNQLLAEPNQQRLVAALDGVGHAAESISRLATRMSVIMDAQLGPDRVNLPGFVKNADAAVGSLRQTSMEARHALSELGEVTRRLNEKGGPVDRLAEGAESLSNAAQGFNNATLPRINRVADEASRAARQLQRAANSINDNPQSLIFGPGAVPPGPGEPGFEALGDAP